MRSITRIAAAATMTFAMGAPLALAAGASNAVSDGSFNRQVQTVKEQLEIHEGVYGPAGMRSEEASPSSTVRDRDIDRYVQRVGTEMRARNALADRDPTGFQ